MKEQDKYSKAEEEAGVREEEEEERITSIIIETTIANTHTHTHSNEKTVFGENLFRPIQPRNFNYSFDCHCLHCINRTLEEYKQREQKNEYTVFKNTFRQRTNKQFRISSDQATGFILCTCFNKSKRQAAAAGEEGNGECVKKEQRMRKQSERDGDTSFVH